MPDPQPKNRNRDGYKRTFDLTILIMAHLMLFPIWLSFWLVIPSAIRLVDGGPVFYRQERLGKNGKVFSVLKFRTMVENADNKGPGWARNNDPRITRVGRILRRTALDELPQIIAIWKGDMSFVGPRALREEEHIMVEEQLPGFSKRLDVIPGLTGLAQVYNRTDDNQVKFDYDLIYLQKMGILLDVKLLVLSVCNTLTARWDQRQGKPSPASESNSTADHVDQKVDSEKHTSSH